MSAEHPAWLIVERREAPLIISIPHAGTDLLSFEPAFADPWLARKDADWRLDELYDFAGSLGATIVRTKLSRSIIDVNRDPSGASLYPGQATTELCPTTTFDGEPLYRDAHAPDAAAIAERRRLYFDPYHAVLAFLTASCLCSISGPTPAQAAPPGCARRSAPCSPRAGERPSSTAASRAGGSPALMGGRAEGSRLCSSSLRAGPIWTSPSGRPLGTGQRRSTRPARRRRARRSGAFSRRSSHG
jgi:hypothetical protein